LPLTSVATASGWPKTCWTSWTSSRPGRASGS